MKKFKVVYIIDGKIQKMIIKSQTIGCALDDFIDKGLNYSQIISIKLKI